MDSNQSSYKSFNYSQSPSFSTGLGEKKKRFGGFGKFGKPRVKFNKKILFILGALVIVVSAYLAGVSSSRSTRGGSPIILGDQRASVSKPKAVQAVNRDFTFPIRDTKGKDISNIVFTIQDVELQDEIIVKGERARAIKGRTFLILSLKIKNEYTSGIQINSRDYVRLLVNGKDEKLGADIHNDPVQVLAISTKYTRIGFPINDTDRNLLLQVGEINGPKETIALTLQ